MAAEHPPVFLPAPSASPPPSLPRLSDFDLPVPDGDLAPADPNDPWGLIVAEASQRFSIPPHWIRAVIRHESGGRAFLNGRPLRGASGTIGLMQLAPETYRQLAARYDLGPDPGDPYDNVMAGTALIREMYEEFGAPLFLAAYNCGARCAAEIRAGNKKLPSTTQKYMAALQPIIAHGKPDRASWSIRQVQGKPAPARIARRHPMPHSQAGARQGGPEVAALANAPSPAAGPASSARKTATAGGHPPAKPKAAAPAPEKRSANSAAAAAKARSGKAESPPARK